MRASVVYPLLWIAWIAAFLAIELSALWSGHPAWTLSEYVWKLEQINRAWTVLRFCIAAFCVWLFAHLVFAWFRLGEGRVKHCLVTGDPAATCDCGACDEDDEPDEDCGEDGPGGLDS